MGERASPTSSSTTLTTDNALLGESAETAMTSGNVSMTRVFD
jgi:hypothetical protein